MDDKLADYLIAAAQQILWLQGSLELSDKIKNDRRDYLDYWYAAQLNLAGQLAAAGEPAALSGDDKARLELARAHHQHWLKSKANLKEPKK